jgi:hypothetical protein
LRDERELQAKLERQREKWRKRKANQRRKRLDGEIIEVRIDYSISFIRFLVAEGYLEDEDKDIHARIEEAAEFFLLYLPLEEFTVPEWTKGERNPREGGPITIKIRLTPAIVDALVAIETEREEDKRRDVRCIHDLYGGRPIYSRSRAEWPVVEIEQIFIDRLRSNPQALRDVAWETFIRAYQTWLPDPSTAYENWDWPALANKPCIGVLDVPRRRLPVARRPHRSSPLTVYGRTERAPWSKHKVRGADPKRASWHDDQIIRTHTKVSREGMRGRSAGSWQDNEPVYHNDSDDPGANPGNRDYGVDARQHDEQEVMHDAERTEREGEKALNKPFDDPLGTPKSFAVRTDAMPDNERGVKQLGKRTIEEAHIEPSEPREAEPAPKDDDENLEQIDRKDEVCPPP